MDYFDISSKRKPQVGDLLISNPLMGDPNFERSVIYLCEHSEQGSLGFVLNKPAEVDLAELMEDFGNESVPLFLGGPVEQNTLHFIYKVDEKSTIKLPIEGGKKIKENIYIGGDFESLKAQFSVLPINNNDIKFFLGYSGWSYDQLEKEIEDNSWIVVDSLMVSNIFESNNRKYWKKIMTGLGGKYKMMSNYPLDPRLN